MWSIYRNSQSKYKTLILKPSSCDYKDPYILVSRTKAIDIVGADGNAKLLDERNRGVLFKNCSPFTDYMSEINNTPVDNAEDLDVVTPMFNLLEYSAIYLKT